MVEGYAESMFQNVGDAQHHTSHRHHTPIPHPHSHRPSSMVHRLRASPARWLLLLSLFLAHTAFSQNYYFRHYQVEAGLSNNTVSAVLQDHQGFMWFGTKDGLNRFDGYTFKVFDLEVQHGLGSNAIRCLYEDIDQRLWVGTDRGLYWYDAVHERFEALPPAGAEGEILEMVMDAGHTLWFICNGRMHAFSLLDSSFQSFDPYPVTALALTPGNEVWLADHTDSLRRYDRDTQRFEAFALQRQADEGAVVPVVEKLLPVSDHHFLVGSSNRGLWRYDAGSCQLTSLNDTLHASPTLFVRDIICTAPHTFWIATESGIFIYNNSTQAVTHLRKYYNDPYSLSDNAVYGLWQDHAGGIWACTYFGGVNYRSASPVQFEKFFTRPGSNAIRGNAIREICKDADGNLWIGTEDAGLNVREAATGRFTHYGASRNPQAIGYHNIHALLVVQQELWIGTFMHGLEVMDLRTRKVVRRYFKREEADADHSDFVYALLQTRAGTLFIGTGIGLYENHPPDTTFQLVNWLPGMCFVNSLFEDHAGNLWAGTMRQGVFCHRADGSTLHLRHDPEDTLPLPSDRVNSIFESSRHQLWLCTDHGLALYNTNTGQIDKVYHKATGFPANEVFKVLEDDAHRLWVSTSKGLVCLNLVTDDIQVYTTAHGLLSNQFNYNSAYQDKDGRMYFGSGKGLISFNPNMFTTDRRMLPIYITGIQVNNEELTIGVPHSPLHQSIQYTEALQLAHDQATFSLDFSALSYEAPSMTRYAYQMAGLDDAWVYLTNHRKVYFTDLSPGTYTFRVKAVQANGQPASAVARLHIRIVPPWWASVWAYGLYGVGIVSLGVWGVRNYHASTERKQLRRQEIFEHEKEKELSNAKIEFFTNIAHEIKTPLTLIRLPLEKMLRQPGLTSPMKENLNIMEKNANRLIHLSNQLLDFRNTEKNVFSLSFVKTDICELLTELLQQFMPAAREKDLAVTTELPNIFFQAYVDPEALKKILSNLFSNAIKYARHTLAVEVLPFTSDQQVFTIQVANDGPLIPEGQQQKIFDPFYRVAGSEAEGTGIGLALAQALTQLHKGTLTVNTTQGVNAFLLSLPIRQEKEFKLFNETFDTVTLPDAQEEPALPEDTPGRHTILLVEDNAEMLAFVARELSHDYAVIPVRQGAEALDKLKEHLVQLIISDVMMPVMDGFALCKTVKEDFDLCHIPVILLTAKNTLQAKIEGLELGADAYIEKPFSQQHLNAQINSLLNNRDKIKAHFASSPLASIQSVSHSRSDEAFLQKITDLIYQYMGQSTLGVELLAREMNMSRQTLYRKTRGLTNLTPHELITVTKLKKAAELLAQGNMKIYEVAEVIGYSLPANFSRDFMKQFGVSPSEYVAGTQS